MKKSLLSLLIACTVGAHSVAVAEDAEFPVLDLHSDIMTRVIDNDVDLADTPEFARTSIPAMQEGNVRDQVLSIWIHTGRLRGHEATQRAFRKIDAYYEQEARHSDDIALALTVADSDRIREEGRIAMWLWIEGAEPINDDLALLRTFHRLGVRGMTLTWNHNLSWAGAATDDPEMGLTDFGREVVREMNRIGMIVDISHVSEQTFWDTLEVTEHPVVATHSSCRALSDHVRNLTDDQLRAVAENGGVVGITLVPNFLSEDWAPAARAAREEIADELAELEERYDGNTANPHFREERRVMVEQAMPPEDRITIEHYIDHIEHAVRVAGPEHVALGSDFDGIWNYPVGIDNPADFPHLAERMRARGFDDDTIRAIFSENALRVFREVIGE